MPKPSICPRPTTKWSEIKKKVGLFEAYRLYNRLGYEIPKVAFVNSDEVFAYVKSFPEISKKLYNGKLYIRTQDDHLKYSLNQETTKAKIVEINKLYNNLLSVEYEPIPQTEQNINSKYNKLGRTTAAKVVINKQALIDHYNVYNTPEDKEYKARIDELNEGQNYEEPEYEQRVENIHLSREDIQSTKQEQRQTNDKLTLENRVDFERKKAQLLKVFPSVSQVIEDFDMPQVGIVEPGGNVIRVNPKYWTTDTIGHEFAHILIDSIGGTENPLVKRGIELLKGSNIDLRLQKLYSDLYENNQDKYWKEVLAQAVGEETSIIFASEKDHSDFYNWIQRLFAKIKQVLGLEPNAIRQIARMVVHDGVKSSNVEFNESRVEEELQSRVDKESNKPTSIGKIYERAKDVLQKKIDIYNKSGTRQKISDFQEILDKIKSLDKDTVEAIKLFEQFATSETNKVFARYEKAKVDNASGAANSTAFTLEELSKWKDYVSSFGMLDDLVKLVEHIQTDFTSDPNYAKLREAFNGDAVVKRLHTTVARKNIIIEAYKTEGIKLVSRWAVPNSNHIKAEFRDKFEREYNTLTAAEKAKETKLEYIENKLSENTSNINELTRLNIESELIKGSGDINAVTRWIDNILDSPDTIVSTVAHAYTTQESKSRWERLQLKEEFVNILRALESSYGASKISNDPQKMYDFMLEKDELGNYTGYIVDRFRSSMWDTYKEFKQELNNSDISQEDIEIAERAWKNENAPLRKTKFWAANFEYIETLHKEGIISKKELKELRGKEDRKRVFREKFKIEEVWKDNPEAVELYKNWFQDHTWEFREPIKKWLNPQYDKLQNISEPQRNFYDFIVKNLDKHQDNIPYGNRIQFRLPGAIKDVRERLTSDTNTIKGSLLHGITDDFHVLGDDTERGTTELTDESDNVKHFIPIYHSNNLSLKYEKQFYKLTNKEISDLEAKYISDWNKVKGNNRISLFLPSTSKTYSNLSDYYKAKDEAVIKLENAKKRLDEAKKSRTYSEDVKNVITEAFEVTQKYNQAKADVEGNNEKYKQDNTKREPLSDYIKKRYVQDNLNKDQSFDLGGIYYKYFSSIIDYKAKREILPQVEFAKYMLSQREVTKLDGKGNPVLDAQGQPVKIQGNASQVAAQFTDWVEALMYGIKEKDLGTILGGKVDVAKLAQKLGKYTALNMLGGNLVQGVANIITGTSNQWIETSGGLNWTAKNAIKAKVFYIKNTPSMLADWGKRKPDNIINILNDKFDVLNEYDDGKFRRNSKFRQLMSTNTLFFTSQAGEHLMQTQVLLSMLDNRIAKDSEGNNLGTMMDCMKVKNGTIVFEGKEGQKVVNFNPDQQAVFEKEVRRILSSMHGEYTEAGRVAIQRNAILNLALMFRKFIVPGVRRRYGKQHVNNLLGQYTEGYYRTTGHFFRDLYKEGHLFKLGLWSTDWNNLLDREKANIRKTITELSILMTTIILSSLLIGGGDDDEDDSWIHDFLGYQVLRWRAEMGFFIDIRQTMKILRSPAASMSTIENTMKLFSQLMPPEFSGFEDYKRGPLKGTKKITKTIGDTFPGYKQIYRLRHPDQLMNWLSN